MRIVVRKKIILNKNRQKKIIEKIQRIHKIIDNSQKKICCLSSILDLLV